LVKTSFVFDLELTPDLATCVELCLLGRTLLELKLGWLSGERFGGPQDNQQTGNQEDCVDDQSTMIWLHVSLAE